MALRAESGWRGIAQGQRYYMTLSLIHILGTWVGRGHPDRVGYMGVDESDEAVGITRKKGVLEGLKACGVECIREISGDYSY